MRLNPRNIDIPRQTPYAISDRRLANDPQALVHYMASFEQPEWAIPTEYKKGCEKARRRRRLAECARKQRSRWA